MKKAITFKNLFTFTDDFMATKWINKHIELTSIIGIFESESNENKIRLIKELNKLSINNPAIILSYHQTLLFIITHCPNKDLRELVEKELNRIAFLIKKNKWQQSDELLDSGLPYTYMLTRFSCDAFSYLSKNNSIKLELNSLENEQFDLNALMSLTMPSLFAEETTLAYEKEELLKRFGVDKKSEFKFLLNQIQGMDANQVIKDYLWQLLNPFVYISSNKKEYSKSFNKISFSSFYYQTELLKNFNQIELLAKKLPTVKKLDVDKKQHLIEVIKNSMLLSMRETDTSIYMDENTLHYYELERGYSIAIYGMIAERQLPIQSYIGFNLFKNGYTVAYGGSWIFGRHAMFGLNLFPEYRGGESGYLMCQILRTYIQVFQLTYIEVDSYMFGNGNEDGIKSAAYWFYYKHGFRSVDKSIQKLAEKEKIKIGKNKNYRTSEKTLMHFAQSNMALNIGADIPKSRLEYREAIIQMLAKQYKGDINLAIEDSVKELILIRKLNIDIISNKSVLHEMALWIKAFKIKDKNQINLALKMIENKSKDPVEYNQIMKKFLDFQIFRFYF